MKKYAMILAAAIAVAGCKDKLKEQPHALITPEFLKTAQGFQLTYDACYAGGRTVWGTMDFFFLTVPGTDEFISGKDGGSDLNRYASGYTPSTGTMNNLWRPVYQYINNCNGLISAAPNVKGIDADKKKRMVAEVKFLRANYYFQLLQQFGDLTVSTEFNTLPKTSADRHPVAAAYDLIVADLTEAINTLPAGPGVDGVLPGKAHKAAAMHVLSKVLLTRGYSKAAKPDDFTKAAEWATKLINDVATQAGLMLQEDFGNVFKEGNEANSEVIWTVQHTANLPYNGPNNSSGHDNILNHLWVPKYEDLDGMQRDTKYGRPYIRVVPTRWLTDTVFRERTNDTRYRKTFQTMWISNNGAKLPKWPSPLPPGAPAGAVSGQPKFQVGDTAIWMPGYDVTDAQIKAAPYTLIPPRKYSTSMSPAMTKYYDTKRQDMNYPSIRSVIVYRLADTYLIAAEALLKAGRAGEALPYINAIRRRAAFPTGNAAAMEITLADLNLDFILDERSRELCGELTRWPDLVRTGKLLERIVLHNTDGQKNIQPRHVLRPIPQAQIDATTTGPKYPQNPGWEDL
ncbi:RagB/SusD family nutrient uptake outer membrane protein [Chitinophaga caseinilytica]|uniref:RagB/SusD family nutrient uptake outer membrane protein n=1 Tax=Chitinophaga caseinilytica TaxID=2267521 RepID=UPI003C304312